MKRIATIVVCVAASLAPAVARADASGEIHGRISEDHGVPLERVRVSASRVGGPEGQYLPQTVSGTDGDYALSNLVPGTYQLRFHVDDIGWSQAGEPVAVGAGVDAHFDMTLTLGTAAATAAGRVTRDGKPVAGVPIEARPLSTSAAPFRRRAISDAEGSFRLVALPAGSYQIARVGEADRSAGLTVEVAAGDAKQVELALAEAPSESSGLRADSIRLTGGSMSSLRARASSDLVLPHGGLEIGTTTSFLTSPLMPGGADALRFSDIVVLGFGARYTVGDTLELNAGVDLLPKQPVGMGEPILHGASLGVRRAVSRHFGADLGVRGAPLLGSLGMMAAAEAAAVGKATVDEWNSITFEGALGGSYSYLSLDADANQWLAEALARADVLLHSPRGEFGGWVSVEFRFPALHRDDRIDPQPRVNFRVGTVYAFAKKWDLYAQFSIVDRGEVLRPETTLPILTDGFDQREILIGVNRRFDFGGGGQALSLGVPRYGR